MALSALRLNPRKLGEQAHKVVNAACDQYLAAGCAQILHLEVAKMFDSAKGRMIHKRVSPFDYMGQVRVRDWELEGGAMGVKPTADVGVDPEFMHRWAVPFAMELKRTAVAENILPITQSTGSGGLAIHQLTALREWIRGDGGRGMAMVLWWNGPYWLRLGHHGILRAYDNYLTANGATGLIAGKGRKSIPAEWFEPVDAEQGMPDFLAGFVVEPAA